ncbi:oligosaccharide flippase family protein [Fuerstiella marisgermanici]|uniref:Polysaccharide biosynthesis protein n=1 Tax=Fuerstiella marisgermanici TaxID=1891926 RepID=A0A1P8WLT1_9PLAN|nr:oligosaccharide flippase family protein [Fuerstiella marisgermanici]APZ95001.1 Polysaccharide biosynthesis protein [Fuerstiella marisgermanici]
MKPVRDLLKHSSIYMIGQILTRMASVLLLPFYTHVLSPADYGITAILDLTAAILSTFIAGGMVSAVTRHHFDGDDEKHHDRVWWTGLTMVATVCTIISLTMYMGRQVLADVTLGPEVANGAWFYTLSILTLWFTVIGMIIDAYLRALKWSGVFVAISLGRLLFNVGINVYMLVVLKLGVEGLLIGNLTATIVHTAVLGMVFIKSRGRYVLDKVIGQQMFHFAAPLVFTAIASMAMHEADRYFLRIWESMDEVGIYSLAHKIGFAVNTLCLLPFISIWHVAIYDIERMPNASEVFAKFFGWFTSGMGILLLGAALTVHPVLPWLTPDAYGEAIDLISVVLLGFFVFGLSFMFEVPSLLTRKTRLMLPGSVAGLVVNVAANMALIPIMGSWGAAWAGVLTYLVYSFCILFACRTVMKIEYPWLKSAATSAAFCGTYVGLRYACFPHMNAWQQIGVSVAVCAFWAVVLFGRVGLDLAMERLAKAKSSEVDAAETKDFKPEAATPELVEA